MNIGIPNEVSLEERRVALTPVGVYPLAADGHKVYLEKGAGISSGFSDQDYVDVGAEIVFSPDEVFRRSDLVVKVQAPTQDECRLLDSGKMLFSFLSLGSDLQPLMDCMVERNVIGLAYELSETPDGIRPILTAMSEIAGVLLPQIAGRYLESDFGGRGITLAGVAGIPPANVVILGAGAVGLNAARAFIDLGAQVLVLDRDVQKLRLLERVLGKRVSSSVVTPLLVERVARFADVLVGAIFIQGKRTPHLISKELVKTMKPGSVIIDVSIDQGGCVETSRPTTLSTPVFVANGVTHYCVPNMASSVPRTASHALNNAIQPWVAQVARLGIDSALRRYTCLQTGLYLYKGLTTSRPLATLFDHEYVGLEKALELQGTREDSESEI